MDRSVLLLYDFLYLLQLIDNHKDLLDKAKSDYENMKRTLYELRASEVLWRKMHILLFLSIVLEFIPFWSSGSGI